MSVKLKVNRQAFALPGMRKIGRHIYREISKKQPRSQSLATTFFRNLRQLKLLSGPLKNLINSDEKTNVLITGCSLGCEAYTVGGYLAWRFPGHPWHITATDIDAQAINFTHTASYKSVHGLGTNTDSSVSELENILFRHKGDQWVVQDVIRSNYTVEQLSTLAPEFSKHFQNYDLVFAQNYLIHMSDEDAERAFSALVATLRPRGALFIGGMDLDLKIKLCRGHGLKPVVDDLRQIHEEDDLRRPWWPWKYWALESFDNNLPDAAWRYATVFVKDIDT
jgi:hypothetical protein